MPSKTLKLKKQLIGFMKKRNLNGVLKLLINIMSDGIVALSNKAPHLMKQKPED